MRPLGVVVGTQASSAACSSAIVAYCDRGPEELGAHRLVPPLDLAGRGRRPRRGQQMPDPVLGADPVEQHRPGPGPNRPVNTLPLSVRICSGTPWAQRRQQRVTHRPAVARPPPAETTNREWSSIPDTTFSLGPIGEAHAAHDVHLPQLHRPGPLPPPVVRPPSPPLTRGSTSPCRPEPDRSTTGPATAPPPPVPAGTGSSATPPRMLPPHLHDPRLDHRRHLMRTRQRPRRPIRQPPDHPRRHTGATTHAPSAAPPHNGGPPQSPTRPSSTSSTARYRCSTTPSSTSITGSFRIRDHGRTQQAGRQQPPQRRKCHAPTGTTVAQEPEPRPKLSPSYRNPCPA